jgi:carbonic anhydrase
VLISSDCGYTHNTDEGIKDGLKARVPEHAYEIDQLEFNCIGSSEK